MMSYYEHGGYYPVGGSAHIAETIAAVVEAAAGRVRCNAKCEEVVVDRDTGVRSDECKCNECSQ